MMGRTSLAACPANHKIVTDPFGAAYANGSIAANAMSQSLLSDDAFRDPQDAIRSSGGAPGRPSFGAEPSLIECCFPYHHRRGRIPFPREVSPGV
jgi:hypothetical protein